MGVVASKGDNNTQLLNLCKERKELIRATRDARNHLAKAHLLYFRSLLDFTNALTQFVHKDLIVIPYSSDDNSSSSDLICSGSDSDSDSDSDCLACDRSQTMSGDDRTYGDSVHDRTCGSSNNVQEGIKMSKQGLGFLETVFMSAPIEGDVMRVSPNYSYIAQNNFPGRDLLGLYEDNTQCVWIEPDQRDEVENDDGWREVREREGIPDLEPETDHDGSLIRKNQKKKKKKQKKKNVEESSSIDKRNIEGEDHETCAHEAPEIVTEVRRSDEDEEVSDDLYHSFSSSSSSFFSESSGSNLTDLRNVVEKINGICEKAVGNCEVSELLEVNRVVHHQPLGDQFKGFASRVLCSSRNSTRNPRGLRKENLTSSLSVTLEQLYLWEKKLYAEVTVEEKLRLSYDKAYEILKNLDQTGAESSKIYEAQTVVKFQLSKINVSVRAVESISMRIHTIRDEELLFQVIEIINAFKEMWRFLAKCHHKQFRAIAKSKSCIHIVEPDSVGSSSRNATRKVEQHIRRYRESLRGYIDAHRGFVKLLNEWLKRNITENDDETSTEAPEIFRVCKDWLREIENVEAIKVLSAVEEMGLRFRRIGCKQVEEEKQRMRTERLCKELERKTKELEEIWGTSVAFQASDSTAKMMMGPELLSLREIVTQEREKHERVIIELNDAVSMSLQECLVPVFEALEDFCLGNLRAYKNIRIREA